MSVLNKIACLQNRRDEAPNQQLAKELVEKKDRQGIQEIANNLWNADRNIQSDCVKVLYEIGYLAPELIADYVGSLLKLLKSRNNRMVWGSMIALSTVAELAAAEIAEQRDAIKKAMDNGSVITVDNGVKILAIVASKDKRHKAELFAYLLKHLATCRPKDVPQHAEKTAVAVDAKNKREFIAVLETRMTDMSSSQAARLKKVIKQVETCQDAASPA